MDLAFCEVALLLQLVWAEGGVSDGSPPGDEGEGEGGGGGGALHVVCGLAGDLAAVSSEGGVVDCGVGGLEVLSEGTLSGGSD